jgi:type IV pilus assembly protein PilN
MPTINLRPWREELRAERQKNFVAMLVAVVVAAGVIFFLWQNQVASQTTYQKARNAYLKTSMKTLDKKIAEIQELKLKREKLLSRMKVIQDLQGTRPVIVRVFDQFVETLPDGLYYQNLTRKAANMQIKGVAESNNRISGLMRNFEGSDWFKNPNLKDVRAAKGGGGSNAFEMTVLQVNPANEQNSKGAE